MCWTKSNPRLSSRSCMHFHVVRTRFPNHAEYFARRDGFRLSKPCLRCQGQVVSHGGVFVTGREFVGGTWPTTPELYTGWSVFEFACLNLSFSAAVCMVIVETVNDEWWICRRRSQGLYIADSVFSIVFSCFSIGFPSKPSWLKRWSIRSHGASTRHAQKRVKTRGAKCKGSTGPSFWHHFLQRQWHLRWGIYPGKEARDLDSPLFEVTASLQVQVTASLQVQVVQFIPIPFVYSHFGQFWPILALLTGTAKCGMAGEWNFVTMVSVMRESGGMAFVRGLEFLHVPIPNERHSLQKSRTFCAVFFLWSYIYI